PGVPVKRAPKLWPHHTDSGFPLNCRDLTRNVTPTPPAGSGETRPRRGKSCTHSEAAIRTAAAKLASQRHFSLDWGRPSRALRLHERLAVAPRLSGLGEAKRRCRAWIRGRVEFWSLSRSPP